MDETLMNIRVSGKLGDKIGVPPDQELPMHDNPYLDWSGHLFRAPRKQYILLTNTASLYSLVMEGAGITNEEDFLRESMGRLEGRLREDGLQTIFEKHIDQVLGQHRFGKALNRSVTGSMNDLVRLAKGWLDDRDRSPSTTMMKLNETPFSYLDYQSPQGAFQQLNAADLEKE